MSFYGADSKSPGALSNLLTVDGVPGVSAILDGKGTGVMNVNVNGVPFNYPREAIKSMGELIELIKSTIDPETIITAITIDDRLMTDNDWRLPLAAHANSTLNIESGSKKAYIESRLSSASLYLDKIIRSFSQARMLFKNAEIQAANNELGKAVQDTRAFIDWYQTILQLITNPPEAEVQKFENAVNDLTDTCEQILQQQLYRSWWAIAESLEKKLEPQLEQMKFACLAVFRDQGGISNQ